MNDGSTGSIRASCAPAPTAFSLARQPVLGLLVLDAAFERIPGDLGRADAWPVPVLRRVVAGAVPARVVTAATGPQELGPLLEAFVAAARALQAQGVAAVTTSCGFLVLAQQALQAAVGVPVATSALLQLPGLLAHAPRVGVLTASAQALGPAHLQAAGVPPARLADVVVAGMPADGHFAAAVLRGETPLDGLRVREEAVRAALALQRRAPDLRTLLLECTNLPPHAAAIVEATGWEVRSLRDDPGLRAALASAPDGPGQRR